MNGRLIAIAILLVAAITGACQEPSRGSTTRTTLAVTADVALTIGEVEGAAEYLFGEIASIAADGSGRIYVADRSGSLIRVYDGETGAFVQQIGREGDGPGEFRGMADVNLDDDGLLYVRDTRKITVLAPRADGGVPDSVVVVWQVPGFGNDLRTRSALGPDGAYYYPHTVFRGMGAPHHFVLTYADLGAYGDTIRVPDHSTSGGQGIAAYPTGDGNMRMVDGLSRAPFEPVAAWAVTRRGTVLSGDARAYVIYETDAAGDTVQTLQGPYAEPPPIPPSEKADSLAALQSRLDALPVPLAAVVGVSEAVAQRRLPDVLPAYVAVHVGSDGCVWVQQWSDVGMTNDRVFHVFDPELEYRGAVMLPLPVADSPAPFFGEDAVYGVLRDPITGVERVARFDYSLPQ